MDRCVKYVIRMKESKEDVLLAKVLRVMVSCLQCSEILWKGTEKERSSEESIVMVDICRIVLR